VAASGTITEDEFFERADTCAGPAVTILFVGYIRPEKGVEYLLEAVGRLQAPKPWRLVLVGPWEQFADYRARLDAAVARLGIGDRLRWDGYLAYGEPVLSRMRGADLLVLPSLSEGTPHVLVEARASGLPVIATAVGGIPTAVTDGVDGILVPPKDAQALADAMARVMTDGDLRRSLIRHGYVSARAQTVDRFVDHVASLLEGPGRGEG
jgi:glycosyltransferase involved in cell wall biosynthesis